MAVALVLYGLTATLVANLGASHWHVSKVNSSDSVLVLSDFRRTDHSAAATGQRATHEHAHSLLQRHHHDATDTTVLAVDGAASGDSLAGDTGATTLVSTALIASGAFGLDVPEPGAQALRRPAPAESRVASGHSRLLERPPKA